MSDSGADNMYQGNVLAAMKLSPDRWKNNLSAEATKNFFRTTGIVPQFTHEETVRSENSVNDGAVATEINGYISQLVSYKNRTAVYQLLN